MSNSTPTISKSIRRWLSNINVISSLATYQIKLVFYQVNHPMDKDRRRRCALIVWQHLSTPDKKPCRGPASNRQTLNDEQNQPVRNRSRCTSNALTNATMFILGTTTQYPGQSKILQSGNETIYFFLNTWIMPLSHRLLFFSWWNLELRSSTFTLFLDKCFVETKDDCHSQQNTGTTSNGTWQVG